MQQNNANKNNKKIKGSHIGFFLISILLVVGIFLLISRNASKPEELTVDDFFEILSGEYGNEIKSMTIRPAGGENRDLYFVTGKYYNAEKKDDVVYQVYLPVDVVNEKVLTPLENGEWPYNVSPKMETLTTFDWGTLISILVPIVLTVFLFIFLFRNA